MMNYDLAQLERRRRLNASVRGLDDGSTDLAVAVHEGAHIVCAWLVGFSPVYATIDPGLGSDGSASFRRGSVSAKTTDRDLLWRHAIVRLSGVEGEKLTGVVSDYETAAKDDLARARDALGLICRGPEVDIAIACARSAAREMLKDNFATLLAVTKALLARRKLDESEIEELLADDDDDAPTRRVIMPDRGLIQYAPPERFG
jgi:hypothetical protein